MILITWPMLITFADKFADSSPTTVSTISGLISTSTLCSFMCFFILPNSVNVLWHISHANSFFSMECNDCWCASSFSWLTNTFGQLSQSYLGRFVECIFAMWVFKLPAKVNFFKHSWHWNFFSPLWMVRCVFKPAWVVNFFGQIWQAYSLPTKCVSWCFFKVAEQKNVFGQNSHCVERLSSWTRMCFFRLYFCENFFMQISQVKGFSGKCKFMCFDSDDDSWNVLEQILQACGFSPVEYFVNLDSMQRFKLSYAWHTWMYSEMQL